MEEENKKEIKYPIIVLDLDGNYRIYDSPHSYIKFNKVDGSVGYLKDILKDILNNEVKGKIIFADSLDSYEFQEFFKKFLSENLK